VYSLFAANSEDSHFVTNFSQSSSFKSLNFSKGSAFFSDMSQVCFYIPSMNEKIRKRQEQGTAMFGVAAPILPYT
jgi:hypothetical protein